MTLVEVSWFISDFSTLKLEKYRLKYKEKYYSSLKKINKEAAIDCVQLDVIDQLSSEFGLGTLLGQMPNGDYDNCWNFHCHVLTRKTELTFPKVTMKQVTCQSKLYCQVISVKEKKRIIALLSWADFVTRKQ